MAAHAHDLDVALVGSGPAGATTGCRLVQAGRRGVVFEGNRFPCYHIGDSLLAVNDGLGEFGDPVFSTGVPMAIESRRDASPGPWSRRWPATGARRWRPGRGSGPSCCAGGCRNDSRSLPGFPRWGPAHPAGEASPTARSRRADG